MCATNLCDGTSQTENPAFKNEPVEAWMETEVKKSMIKQYEELLETFRHSQETSAAELKRERERTKLVQEELDRVKALCRSYAAELVDAKQQNEALHHTLQLLQNTRSTGTPSVWKRIARFIRSMNPCSARLQHEEAEEATHASSHHVPVQSQATAPQPHPGRASLGSNESEKTQKVTAVRDFFSTLKNGRTTTSSPDQLASLEVDQASHDFTDFLKVHHRFGKKIYKQCQAFIMDMSSKKRLSVEELSECVQSLYQNMDGRLMSHFKGSSEAVAEVMDQVEKYIMTCLYKSVFCLETTDDEKDLALQKRIRALKWVTAHMLCVPLDEEIPEVMKNLDSATIDMIEMDRKTAPQDKLECVTNCCNHICSAIALTQKSLASADDFFPTLIYALLRADPPRLWSNIQYISRFSNSKRLIAGREAYCFTNLNCAVAFIEKVDYKSLNLSPEDFDHYMSAQASQLKS